MMTKQQMQIWVESRCKFAICQKTSDMIIQSLVELKVASITSDDLVKIIITAMPGLTQRPFSGQPPIDETATMEIETQLRDLIKRKFRPSQNAEISISDLQQNLPRILQYLNMPVDATRPEYKTIMNSVLETLRNEGYKVISPATGSQDVRAREYLQKQKQKAPAFKPLRPKGYPSIGLPAKAPARAL